MDVRDAVEDDAERLGELADSPADVMRNLVHDRTVRVAVEASESEEDVTDDEDPTNEEDATDDEDATEDVRADDEVVGFVSFDAREGTVHVTQLAGAESVLSRLLEEPIGFADREGMSVEVLVPEDEESVRAAAEDAEFTQVGSGPRFEGTPTTRYRLETGRPRQ